VNHYPHHIGDFNNATRHLSRVERSIYRDLLDHYYDTEKPLRDDEEWLMRRILCDAEDALSFRMVLSEFFVLEADGWHNARCDRELAAYRKMAEGGKRGASVRWGSPPHSHPIATPSLGQCQPEPEPEPEPKKEREPRATRLASDWELPEDWGHWAANARPDLDPIKTAERFADYWRAKPGKDGRKLDWEATWRNWVRDERAPKVNPADVARQTTRPTETVEENRRRLDALNPPLTSEQKARADLARKAALAAVHNITPRAA
jgi:uncharacterized protein YdaU (DUF1376 family)